MKLKKIIFITLLLVCCNPLYALTANDIIAYPVPFNPNKNTLTIGTQAAGDLSGYSVKASIYDINGDLIIEKSGSGNIKWNGRNKSGRVVKPGLYILKVEIEKDDPAADKSEFVKKIIRILIDY
jgi:flagellar hook assembly protein FlgD